MKSSRPAANSAANRLDRLLAIVENRREPDPHRVSTTVREAGDLSCGVFDTRAHACQAVTRPGPSRDGRQRGISCKISAPATAPGDVLLATIRGTALVISDFPWWLGVHHRAVGLCASTSHIADVGGLGFGPDGRQVFEEGLNIPIGYLFRGGEENETLLEILRANVRDPRAAEGDLYSLTACNRWRNRDLRDTR
jgi:N-methylhydantoinase B